MRFVLLFSIVASLFGCASNEIDSAIAYHNQAAAMVQMGMSEEAFLQLMNPAMIQNESERNPKRFSHENRVYVTYFIRNQRIADDLYTDDEYQPYTFGDGRLVAIGWDAIGGMKYTSYDLRQRRASSNKTSVNVNNNVNTNGSNPYFKPYCPPGSKGRVYGCN